MQQQQMEGQQMQQQHMMDMNGNIVDMNGNIIQQQQYDVNGQPQMMMQPGQYTQEEIEQFQQQQMQQ